MRHRLTPLAVALALGLFGARAGADDAALKQVLVTVLADDKGPILNLQAADFDLEEDLVARDVTGARLAGGQLSVAVLLDTSQPPQNASIPAITRDLRESLTALVKTLQTRAPETQISYSEFGGAAVTRVPFTSNTIELNKVLGRIYPDTRADSVLLEAFTDAGRRLALQPAPRRAVVTIDFNSQETSSQGEQKPAVDSVERTGATVWSVTIGAPGTRNNRDVVMNYLTSRTGGQRQTILDTPSLASKLQGIANSLLSQYELTYVRPDNVTTVKEMLITTKKGQKALKTLWMR